MTATLPDRLVRAKDWVKTALIGTLVATHPAAGDLGERVFDKLMLNLVDNDSEEAVVEVIQALVAGADSVIVDLLVDLAEATGKPVEAILHEKNLAYLAALTDKWGHTPSPWKEG